MKSRGFVVHCYADLRGDRLYLLGRLEDGRSFAAAEGKWRPSFHIFEKDRARAAGALSGVQYTICPPELESFDGKTALLLLRFPRYRDYFSASRVLERAEILSPDGDLKPAEAFLVRRNIRGPLELEGDCRPGRRVDVVFPAPEICAAEKTTAVPVVASVDIETDVETGMILAAGISCGSAALVRVLCGNPPPAGSRVFFHATEASLLEAFLLDIRKLDPDVLTGWNFLDFDFPRLAARCAANGIPFDIGRSGEEAKFFPSSVDETAEAGRNKTRRSAAALVPGRQVLDALRIFRSSPRAGGRYWENYSLESVARSVLGEGKLVSSAGEDKIAELKELYRRDPVCFGEYCLRDAELVPQILEKTGLLRLTAERAGLTGVSLDKAWTSVVSFERVYGTELRRRGIAPVPLDPKRIVSGAAGGTVLDPATGLFPNVAVFDFRSLYPTIMLSFNIDPLAHERAGNAEECITAPNGAVFSRERGILPEIIAGYFASRSRALAAGDEEASFVYKILMNSFYGVLGTPSCRYGRTELAGAITSFAKKWLHFSRDWFTARGYRVLYGDTDSLFVETGLGDAADHAVFLDWGKSRARELNAALKETVLREYAVESFMEIRFEKPYRRFMIPRLRNTAGKGRGRAKGYGGYLLGPDGGLSVEVKGMEAVRSDYTRLARRIQVEFLELVFSGGGEEELKSRVHALLTGLRQGRLNAELIYRKRLSRPPESYTSSTPPQVKAARALGWKSRRGTVEFVWTVNGPEPYSDENRRALSHSPLDYDHYAESQILPVVRSIAGAAGWNADIFTSPGRGFFRDGQMELEFGTISIEPKRGTSVLKQQPWI